MYSLHYFNRSNWIKPFIIQFLFIKKENILSKRSHILIFIFRYYHKLYDSFVCRSASAKCEITMRARLSWTIVPALRIAKYLNRIAKPAAHASRGMQNNCNLRAAALRAQDSERSISVSLSRSLPIFLRRLAPRVMCGNKAAVPSCARSAQGSVAQMSN